MFFTSPDKSIQVVVNRSYGQTKNRVLGENLSKKVEPMSERAHVRRLLPFYINSMKKTTFLELYLSLKSSLLAMIHPLYSTNSPHNVLPYFHRKNWPVRRIYRISG